jgi:hypothetical protein
MPRLVNFLGNLCNSYLQDVPGSKMRVKVPSGSLNHENTQKLLFQASLAHCSKGFPRERGEHCEMSVNIIQSTERFLRTSVLEM